MRLIKVDFELFIGFARKSKQPTWKLQIKLVLFSPAQESFCFCQVSLAKSWKMEINITARVFSTLPKKKSKNIYGYRSTLRVYAIFACLFFFLPACKRPLLQVPNLIQI